MPDKDRDLERIQNRIRDVMGPLGSAWNSVENFRTTLENGLEQPEPINIDGLADSLQKSVILLSQASNAVSYQRKVETLKSFVDKKAAKNILKQNVENFEGTKKDLFGTDFKSVLKSAAEDTKDASVYFNQKTKFVPPKKQPFRLGSFQKRNNAMAPGRSKAQPHVFFERSQQSRGSNSSNTYTNPGKSTRNFLSQPGRATKPTGKSNKCSPFVRKDVSTSKPIYSLCRKDKILPGKLGNADKRHRSLKHSKRLGNSSDNKTNPVQRTTLHSNEYRRNINSRFRNNFHVEKRSYKIGDPKEGSNLEQFICKTKNYRGGPTHFKLERAQSIHPIPTLQNGRFEGPENPGMQGGFVLQNRPKRCILHNTIEHKISEICEIQMEGKSLRISLPSFWLRPSPSSLHKIIKNPHLYLASDEH